MPVQFLGGGKDFCTGTVYEMYHRVVNARWHCLVKKTAMCTIVNLQWHWLSRFFFYLWNSTLYCISAVLRVPRPSYGVQDWPAGYRERERVSERERERDREWVRERPRPSHGVQDWPAGYTESEREGERDRERERQRIVWQPFCVHDILYIIFICIHHVHIYIIYLCMYIRVTS